MLLAYPELVELVDQGVIEDVAAGAIQGVSIDIRLGDTFMVESPNVSSHIVDLAERMSIAFRTVVAPGGIILAPGEFCLAHTIELFNLPSDVSAEFSLKSSIARNGLEHMKAGWADATWNQSRLTLELKNNTRYHNLKITPGMFIGQLKFFRHTEVPEAMSYRVRGRYNGDPSVSAIKL